MSALPLYVVTSVAAAFANGFRPQSVVCVTVDKLWAYMAAREVAHGPLAHLLREVVIEQISPDEVAPPARGDNRVLYRLIKKGSNWEEQIVDGSIDYPRLFPIKRSDCVASAGKFIVAVHLNGGMARVADEISTREEAMKLIDRLDGYRVLIFNDQGAYIQLDEVPAASLPITA